MALILDRSSIEYMRTASAFWSMALEASERAMADPSYLPVEAELCFKAVEHAITAYLLQRGIPTPRSHEDVFTVSRRFGRDFHEGLQMLFDLYRRWSYRLAIVKIEQPKKPINIALRLLRQLDFKV